MVTRGFPPAPAARQPLVDQGFHSVEAPPSHSQTNHTRQDSSGRVTSLSQRLPSDNTQKRQTSMPPPGFEPAIPASDRPPNPP